MRIATAAASLFVGLTLVMSTASADTAFPSGMTGAGNFEKFPRWQRVLAQTRPDTAPPAPLFAALEDKPGGMRAAPQRLGFLYLPLPAARPPVSASETAADAAASNSASDCRSHGACTLEDWQAVVEEAHALPPHAQLDHLNRWANGVTYVEDTANWGIPDYWQTPDEFLAHGGDCEDYAIIKYFGLSELGFEPADMRITVLFDEALQMHHAVLLVRLEGEVWLLDNQMEEVTRFAEARHYRPVYSVNETNWWMHRRPGALRLVSAQPQQARQARYANRPPMSMLRLR